MTKQAHSAFALNDQYLSSLCQIGCEEFLPIEESLIDYDAEETVIIVRILTLRPRPPMLAEEIEF